MKKLAILLSCLVLSTSMYSRQHADNEADAISGATTKNDSVKADDPDFSKFRFGGYGEMIANFYDYGPNRYSGSDAGSPKEHRSDIS